MSDKLLTLKEVTEILRCSRYFVIRLAKEGILTCVAFGGKYRRYRQSDVDKFLGQGEGAAQREHLGEGKIIEQSLNGKKLAAISPQKNPPEGTTSGHNFELKKGDS